MPCVLGRTLSQGDGEDATAAITHNPRLITDDMIQMRLAALAGIGVVQLPTMMVDKDLAAGTLVDVLPEWRPRSGIVHAVFASRRGLIDHLVSLAQP